MGVEERVDDAMFNRLLKGAKVSLTGSAFGSVLVVISHWGSEQIHAYWWWLGLVFAAILIRYYLTRRASMQRQLHGYNRYGTLKYCMTLMLSGASWGVLGTLAHGGTAMSEIVVITAIQSMVMGSVLTMASSMIAFFAFTLPAILPLIVVYAIDASIESKVIAVYSLIFLALMIWITYGINQSLRHSQRMRFENDDLILSLKKANERISVQNEELNHVAHHDQLTGLPNRKLLAMRMQQGLDLSRLRQTAVAVLFLDLDGFKAINDNLGHEAGDVALIEVARRLGTVLRATDTLARVGGDEFVILLQDVDASAPHAVERVAQKCLSVFSAPFVIESQSCRLATSIGLALSQSIEYPEHLLAMADKAMYQAKQGGSGQYCWATIAEAAA